MKAFQDYLSQFKSWAHGFAAFALSAALAYSTYKPLHDAVNQAVSGHPRIAGWIGSAAAILLAFANAKKGNQ